MKIEVPSDKTSTLPSLGYVCLNFFPLYIGCWVLEGSSEDLVATNT